MRGPDEKGKGVRSLGPTNPRWVRTNPAKRELIRARRQVVRSRRAWMRAQQRAASAAAVARVMNHEGHTDYPEMHANVRRSVERMEKEATK